MPKIAEVSDLVGSKTSKKIHGEEYETMKYRCADDYDLINPVTARFARNQEIEEAQMRSQESEGGEGDAGAEDEYELEYEEGDGAGDSYDDSYGNGSVDVEVHVEGNSQNGGERSFTTR
jgi:hypothetical protein